jgi:hypothetical protein
MNTLIISQPRYLPAINYLQRLYNADWFVFLDTVQRQGRGWENRNKILMKDEELWLTIPVVSSSRELIQNSRIAGTDWILLHKQKLESAYRHCTYFESDIINRYYVDTEKVLIDTNYSYREVIIHLCLNACKILNFTPNWELASKCDPMMHSGVMKLVDIAENIGCTHYISGENGKYYGVDDAFRNSEMEALFHKFVYPNYKQCGATYFHPWMCFFDVIFNIGLEKTENIVKNEWRLSSYE